MTEPTLEQQLLEQAFDNAPIGFAVFDDHLRYLRVNAALADMNGLPIEAHLGRPIGEVLPDLPPEATRDLMEVLRTGLPVLDVEVSGITPAAPDELRSWRTSQYPLRSQEGHVVGVARVVVEITAQKRAETLQRELLELLTLANETVIVRNPDSTITGWNAAAEALYGFTAAEAVGRNIHELLRTSFPESQDVVHQHLLAAGFWEGELRHCRQDGAEMYVLSRQALQRDAQGRPKAILEINWDITSRVLAQQELRRLNESLERRVAERTADLSAANEQLEAFTYSVAHDLRAPLRSVQGFAEAIREDYADVLDEAGQEMLVRVARSAERMDALIHDLLEYSRLSRAQLLLEPTDLNVAFDVVLRQMDGERTAVGANVHIKRPLPCVLAHPQTLTQVITNLLANALKFVAPGVTPCIDVSAETHGEHVRVYVDDNGIGVEERHRERIWRVFERLHTIEEYPGTGVGLAIVKKGVDQMEGSVGVTVGPGAGSRFWFELPLAPEEQRAS